MIKKLIFNKRLYFSPRFYLYIFFAVALDFSMTQIGVHVLGTQAEKNPYIYKHMMNGTIWSHFLPELMIHTIFLAVITAFVTSYILWVKRLEIELESEENKMFLSIFRYGSIVMVAMWFIVPAEHFTQGVLWTAGVILRTDLGLFPHPIIIIPIMLVISLIYIITGVALLDNELEALCYNGTTKIKEIIVIWPFDAILDFASLVGDLKWDPVMMRDYIGREITIWRR